MTRSIHRAVGISIVLAATLATLYARTEAAAPSPRFTTDFITNAYRHILHREPDPGGMVTWTNVLNLAGPSAVIDGILNSDEARQSVSDEVFVEQAYRQLLGRTPGASEIEFWVSRLKKGLSRSAVRDNFIDSAEAAGKLSSPRYIHRLFLQIPFRKGPLTPTEMESWLAKLRQGRTRSQLRVEVLNSAETRTRELSNMSAGERKNLYGFTGTPPENPGAYLARTRAPPPTHPALVGFWSMDLCSSSLWDDSGRGNHGTMDTGTDCVPGAIFSGRRFHTATTRVEIPDSGDFYPMTNALTMMTWIRPASSRGVQPLIGRWSSSVGLFSSFGMARFTLAFEAPGCASPSTSACSTVLRSVSLPTVENAWQHVTGVYEGGTMKLLVKSASGQEQQQSLDVSSLGPPVETNASIVLGDHTALQPLFPYEGLMDEVRLFVGAALTDEEIRRFAPYPLPTAPQPGPGQDPNPPAREWRYPLAYVWGGGDEDRDGLVDCADPDLAKHWSCQPPRNPTNTTPSPEDPWVPECVTLAGYSWCGFSSVHTGMHVRTGVNTYANTTGWIRQALHQLPCSYLNLGLANGIHRIGETEWKEHNQDTAIVCDKVFQVVGGHDRMNDQITLRASYFTGSQANFNQILSHELTHAWSLAFGRSYYLPVPAISRNVWRDFANTGWGPFDPTPYHYERCFPCDPTAVRPGCDCYAEWSAQDGLTAEPYFWKAEYYVRASTGFGEDFAESVSRSWYPNATRWVTYGADGGLTQDCTPTVKQAWIDNVLEGGTCGTCANGECDQWVGLNGYVDPVHCPTQTSAFNPALGEGGAWTAPACGGSRVVSTKIHIAENNPMQYLRFIAGGGCGVFCWSGITVTLREGGVDYQIVVTEQNGSGTHNNRAYKVPIGGYKPPYDITITVWNTNDPGGSLPRWITLGIPKGSLTRYQHWPGVDEGPVLEPKFGRWFERGQSAY